MQQLGIEAGIRARLNHGIGLPAPCEFGIEVKPSPLLLFHLVVRWAPSRGESQLAASPL